MKLIEPAFPMSIGSETAYAKAASDEDEGVCDLDLEEFTAAAAMRPPPKVDTRIVLKHRYREPPSLIKERLINLTQSKLKNVDEVTGDGLRAKVLLEAALKRCLTQTSVEKRHKLRHFDLDRSLDEAADGISNRTAAQPPHSPCPSPRKRQASQPTGAQLNHEPGSGCASPIKRLRSFSYEDGEQCLMDTSSCDMQPKEELFSDLASVFYRLKTENHHQWDQQE